MTKATQAMMTKPTRKRLRAALWKVAGAKEFLGLTDEEAAIVELKIALADAVREQRSRRSLTQEQLGRLLGSSQSRVAKIEAADRSVSIDLMVRSLLRMGASRKQVASWIAAKPRRLSDRPTRAPVSASREGVLTRRR